MLEAKHQPCQACPGQHERRAKTSFQATLGGCKKELGNHQYTKHT